MSDTKEVLVLGSGGNAGVNLCRALVRSRFDMSVWGFDQSATGRIITERAGGVPATDSYDWDGYDYVLPASSKFLPSVYEFLDRGVLSYDQVACSLDTSSQYYDNKYDQQVTMYPDSNPYLITSGVHTFWSDCHTPGWLRATTGSGAKAATYVKTAQQAKAWCEYWWETDPYIEFISEPYRDGNNWSWGGVFNHGELVAFAQRERMEWGPTNAPSGIPGSPMVSKTVVPTLTNTSLELLSRFEGIELHGPVVLDYIGEHCTEVNFDRLTTMTTSLLAPDWIKVLVAEGSVGYHGAVTGDGKCVFRGLDFNFEYRL